MNIPPGCHAEHNPFCKGIPEFHAQAYNIAFPNRPPLTAGNGMLTGCWMIGACYKNPNKLYGAYPHGYLERVHAMFPDARKILHVFSGGLRKEMVVGQWINQFPDVVVRDVPSFELVDSKGPEDGRYPTWQGDVTAMPAEWADRFDLILADPPYSAEDCKVYDVKSVASTRVMAELHRVAAPGANLVWLDQKWPVHKKALWKTWGTIGLVRSTNHRMRLVSIFGAVK